MYVLNHKVSTSRCNEKRCLKFYSAMQMMQDCSELWLDTEPGVANYFQEKGMAQLLVFRQVDIVRIPEYREDLKTQTRVYEMKGTFGFRNTNIFDAAGKVCYNSWSMGAFVDRASGRLSKISDDVIRTMHLDNKVEMDYADRHIRYDKSLLKAMEPVVVAKDDIDYNGHVNNAQYVRMAMELLPSSFETFRRFRVEYKSPVKFGEQIQPFTAMSEGRFIIVLKSSGHDACIMEFSNI